MKRNQNMEIVVGDDVEIEVTVEDLSDLTGYAGRWGCAPIQGGDPVLVVSHHSINANKMYFRLSHTQTSTLTPGKYNHEAEVTSEVGDTHTVCTGTLLVRPALLQ